MDLLLENMNLHHVFASALNINYNVELNDKIAIVNFNYKNSKYDVLIDLNNKIIISSIGDYESEHLVSLVNKTIFETPDEIIPTCLNYIPNLYKYCISCQTSLEIPGDEYSNCGKDVCIFKMDELPIGEYIINSYKKSSEKFEFIMMTSLSAISSTRRNDIFEPFPNHFLIDQSVNKPVRGVISTLNNKNYNSNKNWNLIDKTINGWTLETIVKTITKSKNEKELRTSFGDNLYILLRFFMMTNKCNINNDDILHNKQLKSFQVIHPFDKEDEFKQRSNNVTTYLYHGSKFENWYSIMRNGIKVCSNTTMMTAGAAYGKGIYTSDNFNTSLTYCGYSHQGEQIIMGVFEVIGNKTDFKPGNNIFVIPNDELLILRYILCFPHKIATTISSQLNDKFNIKIQQEKLVMNNRIRDKGMKRLLKDLSDLQKTTEFGISYSQENIQKWSITMRDFDVDSQLIRDMQNFDIPFVEIEINFDDNYPYSPPFVRVVSPRFMYQTGHITSKGALCMEILTPQKWSPAYSIESLLVQIKSTITEGGAKIDDKHFKLNYSLEEAKQSFIMVAKQHGWI